MSRFVKLCPKSAGIHASNKVSDLRRRRSYTTTPKEPRTSEQKMSFALSSRKQISLFVVLRRPRQRTHTTYGGHHTHIRFPFISYLTPLLRTFLIPDPLHRSTCLVGPFFARKGTALPAILKPFVIQIRPKGFPISKHIPIRKTKVGRQHNRLVRSSFKQSQQIHSSITIASSRICRQTHMPHWTLF